MQKYALLIQGQGTGCDYTIACNRDFKVFLAEDDDDAKDVARKYYEGRRGGEPGIQSITLLEVSQENELDLDELDAGVFDEPEDDKKVTKEAAKRILAAEKRYAALERKFEALEKRLKAQEERDAAAGAVLAVVKELSGQDPEEVAKESGGNMSVVASNLLFEAVRIKAAQMRAKEKA